MHKAEVPHIISRDPLYYCRTGCKDHTAQDIVENAFGRGVKPSVIYQEGDQNDTFDPRHSIIDTVK